LGPKKNSPREPGGSGKPEKMLLEVKKKTITERGWSQQKKHLGLPPLPKGLPSDGGEEGEGGEEKRGKGPSPTFARNPFYK